MLHKTILVLAFLSFPLMSLSVHAETMKGAPSLTFKSDHSKKLSSDASELSGNVVITVGKSEIKTDYAVTDNLVLRYEYRYSDYGTKKEDIEDNKIERKYSSNNLRLGLAYKF